jgi:hypothetical protein
MALKIKTAPAIEPLSLDEAKLHLRIDSDDEDTYITSLIKAARCYAEQVLASRSFITQTWELWLDAFPDKDFIELPMPPLQAAPSVTAGAFVTGTVYRILTVGTTNFALIGASASTVGTVFTATGAGTGTGTATASGIIKYYDTSDVEYTFAVSSYYIDDKDQYSPQIHLNYGQSWPAAALRPRNGVCVQFVAGYGDAAENVPQNFIQGLLLIISDMYEFREDIVVGTTINMKRARDLIGSEKVY